MARVENATCYHCDAEGTGREHVPPKCLFPKGSAWSKLMTVPSCVTHNNANSKADEYLKFLLGAVVSSNIPDAIRSSTARSVVRLALMRSSNLRRYGCRRDGEVMVIDDDIPLDFELLSESLKKVARALYFHHHYGHRKLLGDLGVLPLFIPLGPSTDPEFVSQVDKVRESTALHFEQLPWLGSHQEIFSYQIIEAPTLVINMKFYGAHRASVIGMAA